MFGKRVRGSNEILTLEEYFERCKTDQLAYASAAERMLNAIGEVKVVDTSTDARLSRIFSNRKIRVYPAFSDFFGAEESIERVVAYFRNAAAGMEESKQILYLKGPVGGGKSSIAERLKALMCVNPIYVLYDENEPDESLRLSPVNDSPLSLFNPDELNADGVPYGQWFEDTYSVPRSLLGQTVLSGWALKKLDEFDGDLSKFKVMKIYPDKDRLIGVMKIEPGDENNQDVSVLVGKTDLRRLGKFSQNHPYSYLYSGGLNRTNQGLLDFAEMFKASIKTLNPLLMATQERNYNGTEGFPSLPFTGIILAHSNESEWSTFRNNKTNEAFLDRVYIVDVPYCLRVDDEVRIYEKMLRGSTLRNAPVAPGTLKILAQFMVLTRLKEHENSTLWAKLHVYNGDSVKDTMPAAKPYEEYRAAAGVTEGMTGMSTRFAFKMLSATFDYRPEEKQANPIDLMFVLEEALLKEQLKEEDHKRYVSFIHEYLLRDYLNFLDKELRAAYLDSFDSFGQNMFERYFAYADAWISDAQCRDPETHAMLNRDGLNKRLEDIERPAGIVNVKDFRNEVVNYVLRYSARNGGQKPNWKEYEKIRMVLEKRLFSATENIMPVISFGAKSDSELEDKHKSFVARMMEKGYTENQIRIMVGWWGENKRT
jgi:serine protein kinase